MMLLCFYALPIGRASTYAQDVATLTGGCRHGFTTTAHSQADGEQRYHVKRISVEDSGIKNWQPGWALVILHELQTTGTG
ncbi:hypothetical protein BDU57DRAFT_511598 [Ampelomyces quisqualis]|uniref:Secreted protein n=1 Tax=Ampelomyces quisqualis TaxID=50730 RepID=A0A6A5QW78_AMPQU|nr:hypothetical protein BDU57DRAFT_511598 [Ampelomyces quisqualis]